MPMIQARLVPVDVPGLDLLLGGGVPVFARHAGRGESAVLLVRGPPGSGKSVLGTQLAGAVARTLVPGKIMDVAYGCVELLPAELAAQHAGLKPSELRERVIIPKFPLDAPEPHTGDECRIYADLLALEQGKEQAGIEDAVERLLDLAVRAGGKPRVVVIDSLSDGYNLGSAVPRIVADAVCKLAVAKGMVFILLEETFDGRPSNWSFAADVVMELRQPTDQGPDLRARTINITKNRFGRVEPGPHRASIARGTRYTIWPDPSAYLSGVSPLGLRAQGGRVVRDWGEPNLDKADKWPRLFDQTVAVIGTDPTEVRKLAYSLAKPGKEETEVCIEFADVENSHATRRIVDPYMGGAQLLASIVKSIRELASNGPLARVILGDTSSLRLFSAQQDMIRSLMILSALLHDANIPLILFDSSRAVVDRYRAPLGSELPLIADFADVQIVGWNVPNGDQMVTATQGANDRIQWQGAL